MADLAGLAAAIGGDLEACLEQALGAIGLPCDQERCTGGRRDARAVRAAGLGPNTMIAMPRTVRGESYPDLAGALASLAAAVRPGGAVVVPTFCHAETMGSRALSRLLAITGFPGARRLTKAGLRAACEASGLRVVGAELIAGPIPIGFVSCVAPGGGSP